MRTINRKIVSALLVSADNKLLIGMKNPNKGGVYADCWHIPGGGVEEGESLTDALIREILEEVGIDITSFDKELVYDEGSGTAIKKLKTGEEVECHMLFNDYVVKIPDEANNINVVLSDDLEKYEWADLSKLSEYKLTPPSIELFKRLGWIG